MFTRGYWGFEWPRDTQIYQPGKKSMSHRGSAINGMSHRDLKITRVVCYIRGMILQETWWLQPWWFLFTWDIVKYSCGSMPIESVSLCIPIKVSLGTKDWPPLELNMKPSKGHRGFWQIYRTSWMADFLGNAQVAGLFVGGWYQV